MIASAPAQVVRFPVAPSTTHASVTFDADWRCTAVSDAGAAFFGKTVDALLGQCLMEMVPNAPLTPFGDVLFRAADTGRTHVVDAPSVLHPGRRVWARARPCADGGVRVHLQLSPGPAQLVPGACGLFVAMSSTLLSYAV